MEFYFKGDDGRQKRRQSKDFGEINNLQTGSNPKQWKWDLVFHNWEDPLNCSGRKKISGCLICEALDRGETVEVNATDGHKRYSLVNGQIIIEVIGDTNE